MLSPCVSARSFVDATKPEEYAKALKPTTKVIYSESPANPTCRLTDLAAVGAVADAHAAQGHDRPYVMCDSTFATPFHQVRASSCIPPPLAPWVKSKGPPAWAMQKRGFIQGGWG